MISVQVEEQELFDERSSVFIPVPKTVLELEHSLLSLGKWESKWKKPYLSKGKKTVEETVDYIRCMTINQKAVNYAVYLALGNAEFRLIADYVSDPMTATTFRKDNRKPSREILTAELIYHSMVVYGIPFECQKWHLNRLLTLIQVCDIKSAPPKKMGRKEMLSQRQALNNSRRASLKTRG
jgi:hypothetical protein